MQTQIIDSADGLTQLAAEWAALEARSARPAFYASADFVATWWDAFGHDPDIELRVVCARQNGDLVGLAPLALHTERRPNGVVRVLRFTGRGDYLNFLVAEEARPQAVLKSLFRAIDSDIEWDLLSLTNVAGNSPLGNHLFTSGHHEDFTFHVENPYIDLRRYHDFAEFAETSVPDKARKYRNKLQREIGFEFRVVQGDDTVFERIAHLHRLERDHLIDVHQRTERHSLFDDPDRRRHIEQIFTTTDRAVTFVYVDERDDLLAYRTCYRDGRTLLSWNSAYHPRVAGYRTGKALQYDIMQHLFESGDVDVFDLGAGRYPWKFEWTSDFSVTYRLRVTASHRPPTPDAPATAAAAVAVAPPAAGSSAPLASWRSRIPAPVEPALRSLRTAERGAARRIRRGLVAVKQAGTRARPQISARRPVRIEPRPTIWYVPHPDDETIFMGGSIRANRSAPNLVVLLTRGGASKARERVNARVDHPLDEAAFKDAREREFRSAVAELGIAEHEIVVLDLPDGAVDATGLRDVVRDMERRLPGATHRTMTDLDAHPDHRAAGAAVRTAYQAGEISDCVFHVAYPLVADDGIGVRVRFDADMTDAKRRALAHYTRWDPDNGWYSIGSVSVARLIRQQRDTPEERIHRPPSAD